MEYQLPDNYVDITGLDQILLGCFNTLNSFWLVTMNIVITDTGAFQKLNTYTSFYIILMICGLQCRGRLEGLENNYTGRMSSFHVRMISAFWPKVFVCFITINKGFQVPVFKLHPFRYKGWGGDFNDSITFALKAEPFKLACVLLKHFLHLLV